MMNFRVIAIATLCLAVAAPVIGQGRRGGFGTPTPLPGVEDRGARTGEFPGRGERGERGEPGERGERDPLGRLPEALDLTESQIASLQALLEQRQIAQEGFRIQMEAARQVFQEAVESRDPTAIGNAFLAQRDLQEELQALNEKFMADFRLLLNFDQQQQLDALEAFGRGGFGGSSGLGEGRGNLQRRSGGQ